MIEIDGSLGEGGGQIVRTSVSLSAVTGKSVRVNQIRQKRPKPGLAPQHVRAISILARICGARISGVEPESSEITFEPGKITGGDSRIDIGTAGSVTLLLQCLLPALIKADGPVNLEVHGGTDVQWSPTVDYFRHVFLPALNCFGAKARLDLNQRGYYPKGMGSVLLRVYPSDLKMAHLNAQNEKMIEGISHCSNLPEHVAKRQAETASRILDTAGFDSRVDFQVMNFPSTGSGITLWSGFKGGSALGKKGIAAENVGKRAADEIIKEMRSSAVVDIHLADQLIPYLALAGGSFTTREISMHTTTNIWTAKHFLEKEIQISGKEIFRVEAH